MFGLDSRDDAPSLWRDLRTGDAGWAARLGVSIVAAGACASLAMFVLGVIDIAVPPSTMTYTTPSGQQRVYNRSPIRDEHIGIGLIVSGVLWCFLLTRIWATFGRFRATLRTAFGIVAIWVTAIPTCVLIDQWMRHEELWIAACLLAAGAGTVLLLTSALHQHASGRPVLGAAGLVNLNCPKCGYSMIGLHEARCPECGERFTLDELIRHQDYAAPKLPPSDEPHPEAMVPAGTADA